MLAPPCHIGHEGPRHANRSATMRGLVVGLPDVRDAPGALPAPDVPVALHAVGEVPLLVLPEVRR